MTKRIYVGNLSFQTSEQEISDLFAQSGTVESVNLITDRDTGRSKGFAFVEMNSGEAEEAINRFNGMELNGRALTVNEARPREDRGSRPGGGGGGARRGGSGGGGGRGGFGGGRGGYSRY